MTVLTTTAPEQWGGWSVWQDIVLTSSLLDTKGLQSCIYSESFLEHSAHSHTWALHTYTLEPFQGGGGMDRVKRGEEETKREEGT